jgi:hypothetical protein
MNASRTQLFGKYRGRVLENLDPLFLGRIMADCPTVPGARLNWALPCAPYAGPGVGAFAVPPIGASVWVEFEGGDPDYPIWAGCFWEEGQLPVVDGAAPTVVLKTDTVTVTLDDQPDVAGFDLSVRPQLGDPIRISAGAAGLAITVGAMRIGAANGEVTIASDANVLTLTPETATLAGPAASLTLIEDMVLIRGRIVTGDELA